MHIETIRKHVERRPFIPFTFVLDNGERVRVKHPEAIFIITDWEIAVVENGWARYLGPEAVSEIEKARRRPLKK